MTIWLCYREFSSFFIHFIVTEPQQWPVKWSESCSVLSDSLWPLGYTVHGILQARTLGWVAFPFSRGSSQPRDRTQDSSLCRLILYQLRLKGIPRILEWVAYLFSRESSWFRNRTRVSCTAGGFFTNWDIRQWPRHCFILLKKKILIGVWLIHSTVLASGIQQSEPAPLHHKCIHIHAFFLRFFSRI